MTDPRLPIDRNLARALALSLAVHGLALPPLASPPAVTAGNPALNATLRQPPASPREAAPPPPAAEETITAPAAIPEPLERIYPRTPTPAAPAFPAAPAATPAEPDGHDAGQPDAAPAADNPSPPTPAVATQPARPGVDLAGLRQYHMALARMAARFKHYPPSAREAGSEGRVPMRLEISANGTPLRVSLIGSSGFPVLDQAALDMMQLAAGHTPVPDSLRGQAFSIDLAVDYNLKDE